MRLMTVTTLDIWCKKALVSDLIKALVLSRRQYTARTWQAHPCSCYSQVVSAAAASSDVRAFLKEHTRVNRVISTSSEEIQWKPGRERRRES